MVDPNDPNACIVLGDGAAAAIIEPSKNGSCIEASQIFTIASGRNIDVAHIKGGGTKFHPFDSEFIPEWAYFYIDGGLQLKLSLRYFPILVEDLFRKTGLSYEDVNYIIPHQVIPRLIRSVTESMGFNLKKVYINDEYGNQASASIPIGFAELVNAGKIKRGDRILLIGGAAGFSVGGILMIY
jgi:3-oxoacyl-[acyl-carrier-protein] synthase-3